MSPQQPPRRERFLRPAGTCLTAEDAWRRAVCLPAVLSAQEIAEIAAEVDAPNYSIWSSPKTLDLIDHPAVVPILTDLLAEPGFVQDVRSYTRPLLVHAVQCSG